MNMHISLFFFPRLSWRWKGVRRSSFSVMFYCSVKKTNIQQLKPGSDVVGDETTLFSTEFN